MTKHKKDKKENVKTIEPTGTNKAVFQTKLNPVSRAGEELPNMDSLVKKDFVGTDK